MLGTRVFAIGCALALLVGSCAPRDVRPRDVNDLARDACGIYWSKRNGISIDEAVRAFCIVPEILAPFLQAQRAAEAHAGEQSELAAQRAGMQ
jgi:hypothetical protein